jgi:ferredoxin-NADP reductase
MAKTEEKKVPGLKVVKVDKENHDTTSIFFTGPDVERFKKREAGQFGTIRVLRDGKWTEPHPFTLSSAPEDETLRMTIKKSGAFTSVIPELEPGTPIECAGPFGQFCHGIEDKREIVMIAGGVGITPFLSVLRHFDKTGADNDIVLFWANKTFADAFAAAELEAYTKTMRLRVVHVLSRVEPQDRPASPVFTDGRPGGVSHEYGRISQELLERHLRTTEAAFYLCGPPAMQDTVLAELAKCGVPAERVRKEAFVFKSAPAKPEAQG